MKMMKCPPSFMRISSKLSVKFNINSFNKLFYTIFLKKVMTIFLIKVKKKMKELNSLGESYS